MYRVTFCVARSIYTPAAYQYFDYKHRLEACTVVSWNLKPWVYSQLNWLPHLQGGVVKCNRRSAGLSL